MRLQNGRLEDFSYWDFQYEPESRVSEGEWTERIAATLRESVKLHMISDVPLGAFLSGGMDSSTVVAWMSRESERPIKTYSIGFPDNRFNELPYAREVADYFKTEHHESMVQVDAFNLLPRLMEGFDEPFADSSAIPTYLVSEFARKDVKVAISGDGGDELFGGYLWTQKEVMMEKYRRIPSGLRRMIEKSFLGKRYRPLRENGAWNLLKRFVYDAGLPVAESFARRAMSFQPWMQDELFEPAVKAELQAEDRLARIKMFSGKNAAKSVIDKFLYLDSKIYLPDDLLAKVDRMSMMHSLEVRVPLLDHRLIELACRIPVSLKIKGCSTKYILRKTMQGKLPANVLKQRKQGFAVPLQQWFQGDLLPAAQKLLLDKNAKSRRYFRPSYMKWLLDEHAAGRQRFGTQIHALVVFELWSRMAEESKGRGQMPGLRLKDFVG